MQDMFKKSLQSLQALRAIAALSVVYYHTNHFPNFGRFGVDLFFIISGFVMAWVVDRKPSPRQFLLNRMTRIMPLYWVFTTGLLLLALVSPSLLNSTTPNVIYYLKSLFFIPYYKENGALHPMLAVGWTLNYEMLFYGVMVLGLVATPKNLYRYLVFYVSGFLLSLWIIGHLLPADSLLAAFLSLEELLEFCFGMMVWHYRSNVLKLKLPTGLLLCLILAAYLWMSYGEIMGFSHRLVSFGIPSVLILVMAIQLENFFLKLPKRLTQPLVHIGDASFALYLSHLYVIETIRKILSVQFPILSMDTFLGMTIALFASVAVASLVYVWIDKKLVQGVRGFIQSSMHKVQEKSHVF